MTDPQRQPNSNTCSGTIIHIGAGRCSELPEYLAAKPARIVLVEPQPERARALRQQTADHEHVEVIEAAIAGADSGNQLKVFNMRDLSSLRAPTGLREIYPGLRMLHEIEVERLTPDQLIEQAERTADNWLIIDAPGEEATIIETFANCEQFAAFNRIDMHCGSTSLYEGSQTAATLFPKLAEFGHEIESNDTETDPDRPHWSLRRNSLKLENSSLQKELTEKQDKLNRLEKEIAEKDSRIAHLERALSEQDDHYEWIKNEVARAEGQVNVLRDLFLNETERDE